MQRGMENWMENIIKIKIIEINIREPITFKKATKKAKK